MGEKKSDLKCEKIGDAFTVTVPVKGGDSVFLFENVTVARGEVEASVTVGFGEDSFMQHLSVRSTQSREAFLRQLDKCFGADKRWPLKLSAVTSAFVTEWRRCASDGIVCVADIVASRPSFLLYPYLEEGSANLIFSLGGVGKTYLAFRMAVSVASGFPMFGHAPTRKAGVLFLDWENSDKTCHDRMTQIAPHVEGGMEALKKCFYLDTKGVPLFEMTETIRSYVKDNDIGLVIIDSVAAACGGAPEDAVTASRYFAALRSIGVTSLSIAHESKAAGGNYAFGSIFFTNFSRNVFHIKAADGQKGPVRKLTLTHKKFNNGPLVNDLTFTMSTGLTGAEFALAEPDKKETIPEKVVRILREAGCDMKPVEIADSEALGVESVKNAITVLHDAGSISKGSKRGYWKFNRRE